MNREEFLRACEAYLGSQSPGEHLPDRGGRWGRWHRQPGFGRFENHGVVRWLSSNCIHFALNSPRFTGVFDTPGAALEWLESNVGVHRKVPVSGSGEYPSDP